LPRDAVDAYVVARDFERHRVVVKRDDRGGAEPGEGDGENAGAGADVQRAQLTVIERRHYLLDEFEAAARGRVRAGAEGHARLYRDDVAAAVRQLDPRRRDPQHAADLHRREESPPGMRPVIFRECPPTQRLGGKAGINFPQVAEKGPDLAPQRRRLRRPEKRAHLAARENHARRASLNEKVRDGVVRRQRRFERQLEPWLRHGFFIA
jgi:hypothetical protein